MKVQFENYFRQLNIQLPYYMCFRESNIQGTCVALLFYTKEQLCYLILVHVYISICVKLLCSLVFIFICFHIGMTFTYWHSWVGDAFFVFWLDENYFSIKIYILLSHELFLFLLQKEIVWLFWLLCYKYIISIIFVPFLYLLVTCLYHS